eukprot:270920-Prymnesium_polylepis.1
MRRGTAAYARTGERESRSPWLLHEIRSCCEHGVRTPMFQGVALVPVAGLWGGTGCPPSYLSLCVEPGLLLVRAFCFWCVSCARARPGSNGGVASGRKPARYVFHELLRVSPNK